MPHRRPRSREDIKGGRHYGKCCRGALAAGWLSEAGIATSEFKLLLRVAALCVVVCLAMLVLLLEIAGGDFEGQADGRYIVGKESSAAPRWTSKYAPGKIFGRKKCED